MTFQAPPENRVYAITPQRTLSDLKDEMSAFGLRFDGAPIVNSDNFQRVPCDGKKGKPGYYIVTEHDNGFISASYGNKAQSDEWINWHSRSKATLTPKEKADIKKHDEKANAERERINAEAAQKAGKILEAAEPVTTKLHPYLHRKQIQPHDIRIAADNRLIVPVYINDQIASLQYIKGDGQKQFMPGGKVGGGYYLIPGDGNTAVVCEGFATAASLAEATGNSVYCAFNAGNLGKVVAAVKPKHNTIIIAGDDDKWTEGNPGRKAAEAAAREHNCPIIFPIFTIESAAIPKPTDFNDMACIEGPEAIAALKPYFLDAPQLNQPAIRAIPFQWIDPKTIPPRRWVYDNHYIRKFASITGGISGSGKSTLQIVEALAIATGKPLLGKTPSERCPVWYINLEDPKEEIDRRIMAAVSHYNIDPAELEGWLFVYSGRDARFVLAKDEGNGIEFVEPDIDAFENEIKTNGIGVVILDPFVKLHRVPENSNDAIDKIMTQLAHTSDEYNCAIELAHHLRKGDGKEATVDDIRGAGALLGAVRSARILVRMTDKERNNAGVKEHRNRYLKLIDGKGNMAPPSEKSDWYFLENHDLENTTNDRPSDFVGVATS